VISITFNSVFFLLVAVK